MVNGKMIEQSKDKKPERNMPTVKDLKAEARRRGIVGYYRMNRMELLQVLGIELPLPFYLKINELKEVAKERGFVNFSHVKKADLANIISNSEFNEEKVSLKHLPCTHGAPRDSCPDCRKTYFCHHGKRKCICVDCNGSYICPHKKEKNKCRECYPPMIINVNRGLAEEYLERHRKMEGEEAKNVIRRIEEIFYENYDRMPNNLTEKMTTT